MKYRTLYNDNDGQVFVGQEWEANTKEEYDAAVETEKQVLEDIDGIEFIQVCLVTEIIERSDLVQV